jgi:MFS family permease
LLDGVGAGIFGALAPLVTADIMRGTGRFNLAQGAIGTAVGIGASLSGLAAGEIVDHFGYEAAFLALGVVALIALIVFFLCMRETAERETALPQNLEQVDAVADSYQRRRVRGKFATPEEAPGE